MVLNKQAFFASAGILLASQSIASAKSLDDYNHDESERGAYELEAWLCEDNLNDYRELRHDILSHMKDLNENSSPVRCWSADPVEYVLTNWFEFYAGPEPDVELTKKIYVKIYATWSTLVSEKLSHTP